MRSLPAIIAASVLILLSSCGLPSATHGDLVESDYYGCYFLGSDFYLRIDELAVYNANDKRIANVLGFSEANIGNIIQVSNEILVDEKAELAARGRDHPMNYRLYNDDVETSFSTHHRNGRSYGYVKSACPAEISITIDQAS